MIKLTKIDQSGIIVNVDCIKYVQSVPDTLIHFINGETLIVRETFDELIEQVVRMRSRILRGAQGPAQPMPNAES